ncbi:MAG: hypothetical protein ACOCP8_02785 [archaeon]
MGEDVFDYSKQKILVDLDYSYWWYFGEILHGYYRLGLIRKQYPNSFIVVKINKIFKNFKFKEADKTIYSFSFKKNVVYFLKRLKRFIFRKRIKNIVNYYLLKLKKQDEENFLYANYSRGDFNIIFRHSYVTGAKRELYESHRTGLDFPLQSDPNNRDFTGDFKINQEIYNTLPELILRNKKKIENEVNDLLKKFKINRKWVYINFRESDADSDIRNFSDEMKYYVLKKLSKSFPNKLIIFHTYRECWKKKFRDSENIFLISSIKDSRYHTRKREFITPKVSYKTNKTNYRIKNEIIFYLIKNSELFVTSGNTGLGCFAQYTNSNMVCFVAENEINWITKSNNYYSCKRKKKYSHFSKEGVLSEINHAIELIDKDG